MSAKQATVKAQVIAGGARAHGANGHELGPSTAAESSGPAAAVSSPPAGTVSSLPAGASKAAEAIRIELAAAWGEMGAAWGVTPAIARVQAYLMARQVPLTEREVREALGLSHRAASLALAEAESWGIVERVPEPRRVGRRGPAGTAYLAVGDHWQWFGRVIAERKVREGDPIVAVLESKEREAAAALATHPEDAELAALREWLSAFLVFVRLFDRAVGLVPQLEPRELERSLGLLGRIPDATILRLFDLLGGLPDQDVIDLVEALSRLSPTAARRATKLMSGVIRTVSR
jgi:DNA-binding transcriptional regulator GbsR (MarR family)